MSQRKEKDIFDDLPSFQFPRFSTGEAANVLDIPIWRLQKFLDVRSYPISPSGRLGEGKGSRRMFSTEDLYRIAIADFLLKDGLAPSMVARILRDMEDHEFVDDDQGGEAVLGVHLVRSASSGERTVKFYFRLARSAPPKEAYYALDFSIPIGEVNRRINEKVKDQERR
jgi:hypothetical protein